MVAKRSWAPTFVMSIMEIRPSVADLAKAASQRDVCIANSRRFLDPARKNCIQETRVMGPARWSLKPELS
jgi:hypothetical protein